MPSKTVADVGLDAWDWTDWAGLAFTLALVAALTGWTWWAAENGIVSGQQEERLPPGCQWVTVVRSNWASTTRTRVPLCQHGQLPPGVR